MDDFTGLLLNVSGRVQSLENHYTYIQQQLLQRPSMSEFSQYQNIWNRQLTEIADSLALQIANIRILQQLYVNLNMTVSDNFATFTGHSGNGSLHNGI